jgi:hypothetical protein
MLSVFHVFSSPFSSSVVTIQTGRYNNFNGSTDCLDCARGRFQDEEGQTFCKICSTGQFVDAFGQSECKVSISSPNLTVLFSSL